MQLNLQQINTVFISPCVSKYKYKCFEMQNYLNTHNFKWKLYKSELRYPYGLSSAFKQILLQNLNDDPLLILEDDARLQIQNLIIHVPKNADAIYLGISAVGYGYFPFNSATVQPIKNDLFKVHSMYSAHAILYLSKRYKKAVADVIEEKICDVEMARIQHKFNVYAYNKPLFIQKGTDINATLTKTTLYKIYMERKLTVLICIILCYLIILKVWKFII